MPDNSASLALPYIQPSQAQKHVTHNEALARLDVLVQLVVAGFDATTPPLDPDAGETHALGSGASGAWAGQDNKLATWRDGVWHFITPLTGWRAAAGAELRIHEAGFWLPVRGQSDNLDGVGINATHDAGNRLSLSSTASLFNHEGAGHQLKLNKAASGDTASLLFQAGFTGHAEMGLNGGNDFSLKVSDDGSGWSEALHVSGSNGRIGIGTSSPSELLDINSDAIRLRTDQTPASASASGQKGQICWDSGFVYVCTATDTWKRSALSSW